MCKRAWVAPLRPAGVLVVAQGWQLTTYLDPELRVTRGDGGAVYIFKKAEPKPLE
jgi:hypothetical protein